MTKQVRIENADTSDHKLVVQVWDQGSEDPDTGTVTPDSMVSENPLDNPADMLTECVHSSRYLVVKEV